MTKNDKDKTVLEILEDFSKSSNDIALIKDNLIKLMKGKFPVQRLIYYLDKCNPIMLLRIKTNLKNYKEITKFKRDVFVPDTALFVSFIFGAIAIFLNIVETKSILFYLACSIEVLLAVGMVYIASIFIDIKRITKLENDIEVVLYLVDFMLENKKDELNMYSENLYTKNKKAPVKNPSAEK